MISIVRVKWLVKKLVIEGINTNFCVASAGYYQKRQSLQVSQCRNPFVCRSQVIYINTILMHPYLTKTALTIEERVLHSYFFLRACFSKPFNRNTRLFQLFICTFGCISVNGHLLVFLNT